MMRYVDHIAFFSRVHEKSARVVDTYAQNGIAITRYGYTRKGELHILGKIETTIIPADSRTRENARHVTEFLLNL